MQLHLLCHIPVSHGQQDVRAQVVWPGLPVQCRVWRLLAVKSLLSLWHSVLA